MRALCLLAGMLVAAHTPSLKKAIALYKDLNDAAAAKELQSLLKTELTDDLAAKAHIYLGLIAFNSLHSTEARDEFKRALTLDPTQDLPLGVSPKARLAFAEAHHQLQLEMAKPVQHAAAPVTPAPVRPPPPPVPTYEPPQKPDPNEKPDLNQSPPPELVLIPPPAPPSPNDEPLVEEHVKPEPAPSKSHGTAIALGTLGLIAGGIAIVGAVEVANYNSTLGDARRNPGKYTGNQIASQENTAQIWQISSITLVVVAGLGLGGAVLTW